MEGDRPLGQVRGGRGGGRQQMEQAARRHPLTALTVRAEVSPDQRHHLPGHGGHLTRPDRGCDPGQDGQHEAGGQRPAGASQDGDAEKTSPSVRGQQEEGGTQWLHHDQHPSHPVPGGDWKEPILYKE